MNINNINIKHTVFNNVKKSVDNNSKQKNIVVNKVNDKIQKLYII